VRRNRLSHRRVLKPKKNREKEEEGNKDGERNDSFGSETEEKEAACYKEKNIVLVALKQNIPNIPHASSIKDKGWKKKTKDDCLKRGLWLDL